MGKKKKRKNKIFLDLIIGSFILLIAISLFYSFHERGKDKKGKDGLKLNKTIVPQEQHKKDINSTEKIKGSFPYIPANQEKGPINIVPGEINIINESLDENETYHFEVFNALNHTVDCNVTIYWGVEKATEEIGTINVGLINQSKGVPESIHIRSMPMGMSIIEAKPSCR